MADVWATDSAGIEDRDALLAGLAAASLPAGGASAIVVAVERFGATRAFEAPPGRQLSAVAETEAAPAIWEDREGFNEALATWREATDTAIAAKPQTLDDAKPVVGPVFQACKNCHDTYRIED